MPQIVNKLQAMSMLAMELFFETNEDVNLQVGRVSLVCVSLKQGTKTTSRITVRIGVEIIERAVEATSSDINRFSRIFSDYAYKDMDMCPAPGTETNEAEEDCRDATCEDEDEWSRDEFEYSEKDLAEMAIAERRTKNPERG